MRRTRLFIVLMAACLCPGCALDRTWFQMSSNSPMPFFGFDLRLPRKTSQMEPLGENAGLAKSEADASQVRPVVNKTFVKTTQQSSQPLSFRRISTLLENGEAEEITFTGPKPPFVP